MLQRRRTKLIATVGPATRDPAMLQRMIRGGVDIFRLNLSHGSQDQHRQAYSAIREAAQAADAIVAILADLCGPKIRVGEFANGWIELETGQHVTVTTREILGGPGMIPCQYAQLGQDVKAGDHIRLDDGLLELAVDSVESGTEIYCTVVTGGILKDRKGMNLPGVNLSTPSLTEKDKSDAKFALDLGVDLFALSFVRKPEDVQDLRQLLADLGSTSPIIAKIEKPQALECIAEILEQANGIMVARGDLGVELAPELVPIVQAELISKARLANKPVIVATQMLESMVQNQSPTRAEVSDVSTAVLAGADAVMLSAETSVGSYPLAAVQIIDRVAREMENWMYKEDRFRSLTREVKPGMVSEPLRPALARSMAQLSRDLKVPAVVVRSQSGESAGVVSATRPAAPILVISTDERIVRRLKLLWGVVPQVVTPEQYQQPRVTAREITGRLGLASPGDTILLLSGVAGDEPSLTVLKL
jgi:pyruvate kinase